MAEKHEHEHHEHHHEHHDHHAHHHQHVSENPTVLITGANSGIGLATAIAFASKGWNTYATVRDLAKAPALVKASQSASVARLLHVIVMDVTNSASIDDGVKYEGRIDCMINNAGIGISGSLEATNDADVQRMFSTNVFSVIAGSRSVIPYMRSRGKGIIINISSALSFWTWPMTALYCSTKFAVDGFSSALGKEVAPFGIRVVTVHPSITKSSFGENVKPGGREFPTEIYDKISAEHAKNLAGGIAGAQEPDTVAKACLEAALDQDKERVHYFCDAVTEERAAGILKEPRKDRPTFY